ncbi:MAG: NADH-quinone oxidoreductase subunit L [Puniceicoccales bacterium]|jgi:NADH-quinone oxidoreductase subunit L|nr:NADH-quinone oxidoreductase subunit L [Puniceicoccales bacterium]
MNLSPENLLWLLLGAPLASAVLGALFLRKSRVLAPVLSVAAAGVALAAALGILLQLDPAAPALRVSQPWLALGDFRVSIGFLIDANAAALLFTVTFVAFWIHLFSVGYMDDDPARGRFFAGLSVFMFSILGIVVADNLYMLFVFWELVGFSSYLLIAHYFTRPDAVAASKKAFIVNRVGDLGLLLGIVLCNARFGTVNLDALAGAVNAAGGAAALANEPCVALIAALLACGFIGKSAQFPLHVWLTDAMAGPTPVSALIHAATMVAAGVYFLARIFFLLAGAPVVLDGLLWGCAAMAAAAAFCALAQTDIKKSLAYSTLSHLGFMGAAVGLRLPEIALLHLVMHAFFKAALFLCAGSVIHACHHEQDMTKMGGLARRMPVTHLAFVLAGLSLCALPPLAGWFSKDSILAGAWLDGRAGAFALLAAAALGSALYIGRMWLLVFIGKNAKWHRLRLTPTLALPLPALAGEPNSDAAAHARESSLWLTVPLIVLGIAFAFAGVFSAVGAGDTWLWLGGKFNGLFPAAATLVPAHGYHALHEHLAATGAATPLAAFSLALTLGGLAAAVWFYRRGAGSSGTWDDALRARCPLLYRALEFRYFDTAYDWWVAKVQQPFANMLGFLDTLLINGLAVRGVGAGLPALAGLASRRLLHSGKLRPALIWLVAGAFGAAAALMLLSGAR